MKDARYLIRLANAAHHAPAESLSILEKVRQVVRPVGGKAMNLRVSSRAIEFDVFLPSSHDPRPIVDALTSIAPCLTCKRLDVPPAPMDPAAAITEARALFKEERCWEVHEVLEVLWKSMRGPEKEWVQGLILIAAALVHVQKNETGVVWTMLADARRRLEGHSSQYFGLDLDKIVREVDQAISTKKISVFNV